MQIKRLILVGTLEYLVSVIYGPAVSVGRGFPSVVAKMTLVSFLTRPNLS
ncbi:hypothetical protein [Leptospira sp. mild_001]|nr:hypothetical protein [Leptospira sp. mild_001]